MFPPNSEDGFSLIELLVTILLIAVIAAIMVPAIFSWMPDYRLKNAARQFRADLQRAKLTAIKERITCAVEFVGGDGPDGYVVYLDADNDQERDGKEIVVARVDWEVDYDGDVDVEKNTFLRNHEENRWVAFRTTGLPRNAKGGLGMGTLRLTNRKGTWRSVVLSSAGNIRIDGSHSDALK